MSGTKVDAIAPALDAGSYDVRMAVIGGASTVTADDRYTAVARPTMTGSDLTSGRLGGGDRITVCGSSFEQVQQVLVGGTAGTDVPVAVVARRLEHRRGIVGTTAAYLRSLACSATYGCIAVGNVVSADGSSPWIADHLDSVANFFVPQPAVNGETDGVLWSVSCSDSGGCVSAGSALDGNRTAGYVLAERAGYWVADETSQSPTAGSPGLCCWSPSPDRRAATTDPEFEIRRCFVPTPSLTRPLGVVPYSYQYRGNPPGSSDHPQRGPRSMRLRSGTMEP